MDIRSRQLKKLGCEGKVGGWRDGGRGLGLRESFTQERSEACLNVDGKELGKKWRAVSRRSIISEEAGRRNPKHDGVVSHCVGREGSKVVMDASQCVGVATKSREF